MTLHLVQGGVSMDTVAALESLLTAARHGDIVGLAYVAISRNDFTVNLTGDALKSSTLTTGMIYHLQEHVNALKKTAPKNE